MPVSMKTSVKMVFFDRNIVRRNWSRMNMGPLQKAGMKVMRKARGSIRRGTRGRKDKELPPRWKRKGSRAGRPPKQWAAGNSGLRLIFSVPNKLGTDVMVGPVGFGGVGAPTPELMEHGGTAVRQVWKESLEFVHRRTKKSHGKYAKKKRVFQKAARRTVRYEPRPFMFPALMKTKEKFPELWKGSLTKTA